MVYYCCSRGKSYCRSRSAVTSRTKLNEFHINKRRATSLESYFYTDCICRALGDWCIVVVFKEWSNRFFKFFKVDHILLFSLIATEKQKVIIFYLFFFFSETKTIYLSNFIGHRIFYFCVIKCYKYNKIFNFSHLIFELNLVSRIAVIQ